MADRVLTTASSVTCFHGFAITFTSSATLTVGGKPVVRSTDVASAIIACTAQQKCTVISTFKTSATVRDGLAPVVLAAGLVTNIGACQQISAGHDLLQPE